MSKQYDNWERLVQATLRREAFRQLCRQDSLSSISSSSSASSPSSSPQYSRSFRKLEHEPPLPSDLGMISRFPHRLIALATDHFSDRNLLARGSSGDLFMGLISEPVMVKRVGFGDGGAFSSELTFFSSMASDSPRRFVPLLGHCSEKESEKFLIYKYLPKRDLANAFYHEKDGLRSLDWISRWKIARGVAEGLAYLHHECYPPLVHGDVQASSILLDDNFEVRLGSLSRILVERNPKNKPASVTWRSKTSSSGTLIKETREYDVYCLGKVLLELVTGNLGISSANDSNLKEILEATLLNVNLYDMELVTSIVDPTLIIDEDLLEEVWAMAVIAKSCLNPDPNRRPIMRYVLKALENPLRVVREEDTSRTANEKAAR
ncbi:Lrr receptor protein kinase [Striga asiatica]|uniref:Lrr receptor protein kinase n=1 Tax=Striga asiatica TaxID=4170 RepID=A0A5A7QY77_STRAF|nr:Lrr receptor protein kinase [Striga asiatica]